MKEKIIKVWQAHIAKDGDIYVIWSERHLDRMTKAIEQLISAEVEKRIKERCKKCKYRGLPDSINEALNSGDGVYRP